MKLTMTKKTGWAAMMAMSILGMTASPAFAARWVTYSISHVSCGENGVCYVQFTSNVDTPPMCQDVDEPRRAAWKSGTEAGRSMTSVVMGAYLSGRRLRVRQSSNNCLTEADTNKKYTQLFVVRIND